MTETKNNNGLKVIAGLLGVVLLGTIIYTVSLYQDKKKTTAALQQEKDLVVEDLVVEPLPDDGPTILDSTFPMPAPLVDRVDPDPVNLVFQLKDLDGEDEYPPTPFADEHASKPSVKMKIVDVEPTMETDVELFVGLTDLSDVFDETPPLDGLIPTPSIAQWTVLLDMLDDDIPCDGLLDGELLLDTLSVKVDKDHCEIFMHSPMHSLDGGAMLGDPDVISSHTSATFLPATAHQCLISA